MSGILLLKSEKYNLKEIEGVCVVLFISVKTEYKQKDRARWVILNSIIFVALFGD